MISEWLIKNARADVSEIARALNISETAAQIVINRGIRSYEDARAFLNPQLSSLHSPFEITGVREAVERLLYHIKKGSKIAVYGDYDVDGVMSAVILIKCLKALNADYVYYVPDRENEGYGLNPTSVTALCEAGVKLIVACDNGISAMNEAELAYKKGMELIIIDHHEPGSDDDGKNKLPRAEAIIDPKIKDCKYPFKEMCAAGLCYRFAEALFDKAGCSSHDSDDLLVFAAIATVCDIVDILGDNRIIVKNGLARIPSVKNIGLNALLKLYNLKNITTYHLGFVLGPAINASGRLESARTAVRLFLTGDSAEADEIAKKLFELNISRREMTEEAYTRLQDKLLDRSEREQGIYVLYDNQTHESVAGIVAGKIKERFNHPTIVITDGKDYAKGSARSILGYNIFDALSEVSDLFIKYGGHSQAAGFSLQHDNIDVLRRELNRQCSLTVEDFIPKTHIDMRMPLNMITNELCQEIELLAPFGKGNKVPLFAEKGVEFKKIELVGKDRNVVKLWLRDYPFAVISFDGYDKFIKLIYEKTGIDNKELLSTLHSFKMDIVFSLVLNEFRGAYHTQLVLKDFR